MAGRNASNLKKVVVISQRKSSDLEQLLLKNDFTIVKKNPDFAVCYGGDGTVLFAERKFPQIPKLIVKHSSICRKCDYRLFDLDRILRSIGNNNFKIQKWIKVEGKFKTQTLIGLNEIQVHTKLPIYAIRFSISIDGREYKNLIGDGVIVATPFGSTGYYKSTGGKPFENGLGISFNNLHNKKLKSIEASENSTVEVFIERGPARSYADNSERFIDLGENDVMIIRKAKSVASFIYVE